MVGARRTHSTVHRRSRRGAPALKEGRSMGSTRLIAGIAAAGVAIAVAGTGAAGAAAPSKTTIKAVQTFKFKPNRYVQDGLRWNKDVYRIRSGGTLTVV